MRHPLLHLHMTKYTSLRAQLELDAFLPARVRPFFRMRPSSNCYVPPSEGMCCTGYTDRVSITWNRKSLAWLKRRNNKSLLQPRYHVKYRQSTIDDKQEKPHVCFPLFHSSTTIFSYRVIGTPALFPRAQFPRQRQKRVRLKYLCIESKTAQTRTT